MSDQIIIKTYTGNQREAMQFYQTDAELMASKGYLPIAQSWAAGRYSGWDFLGALLLCFILVGILIFVYMLVVKPLGTLSVTYELRGVSDRSAQSATGEEKTCPKCAERVKAAALVCRFCGHEFAPTSETTEQYENPETIVPIETVAAPAQASPSMSGHDDAEPTTKTPLHKNRPILVTIAFIFGVWVILAVVHAIDTPASILPVVVDRLSFRPAKIGDCVDTSIAEIGDRLENMPGSGTAVTYANGILGDSWQDEKSISSSRVGDQVNLCLVEIEKNCLPGTEGRTYSASDLKTGTSWTLPDSFRACEGAQQVPDFAAMKKAAEQGNADAQNKLGAMYFEGNGTTLDNGQAIIWFQKSADQGFAKAQYNLGQMYRQGKGLPKDAGKALAWYQKAADQGYAEAKDMLLLLQKAGGAPVLAHAESTSNTPVEYVTAPGGNVVYYIMSMPGKDADGNQNMEIEAGVNENRSFDVLLTSTPSNDPAQNLTDFSHLFLSPDSKTLYFQTEAWATSGAIHAINLATKKASYVTPGTLHCVVLSGQYQGDLVVEQHRYFAQGGSYNALWLYDPSGKEIELVSQDTDASRVCPSLGN